MTGPPTGTVTFLFTDIEGSTHLLQQLGDRYAELLSECQNLLRALVQKNNGHVIDNQGDALFAVSPRAQDALAAAVSAQRALAAHPWPGNARVRVRMGLHTGEGRLAEIGYVGIDVHRAARICAVGHGGQILLSEATRILVEDDLPKGASLRDLGEHRLKDLARPQHLFEVIVADLPADFPPLQSLGALPNNLPVQLTSFIGREQEIAQVGRLLATSRLLTLTGVGGCGKTRLALQVAADRLGEFAHGVWVVELAPLSDPALVPQAVASSLGVRVELASLLDAAFVSQEAIRSVREPVNRPILATLTDYLRPKDLLIVLDNCEHMITACAQLAEHLLRSCPNVRILATSREALGIAGEMTYPVPPLSMPDIHRPSAEDVTRSEAVRLFIERAVFSHPGFALTDANGGVVAQLCRRLDGIPLAIELAAARVNVLSAEEITARLGDRFRLLTGGSRTALPRHQTLQAAIDWSYNLLSQAERMLMRRLAVFAGGFTLGAAEGVCAGDGVDPQELLDLLAHLVSKSLVVAERQNGATRYRLVETVRQYSQEKLMETAEVSSVRRRHLDWFLALAEQGEAASRGTEQEVWMERLDREHDNLRTALEWSLASEDAERGLRLAGALGWFWLRRGYVKEARDRLEQALGMTGAPAPARAKALLPAADAAEIHFDHRRARSLAQEGLALARDLGDRRREALSLGLLGDVTAAEGDHARAGTLYQDSLAMMRQLGDTWGIARALCRLGSQAMTRGDALQASVALEEGLALFKVLRDKFWTAIALDDLGFVARLGGEFDRASALYEESLKLRKQLGAKSAIAWTLHSLAGLAREQGDYRRAIALNEEVLSLFRDLGIARGILASLHNLGLVLQEQGDYRRAIALHEEQLVLAQQLGDARAIANAQMVLGVAAVYQGDYARATTLLEASLGIFRQQGTKMGAANSLHALALVAYQKGECDRAAGLCREDLVLFREIGYKWSICRSLARLAGIVQAQGQQERAIRLFSAAEALSQTIGAPLPPRERAEYDRNIAILRGALAEQTFSAWWAEGRAMTLEQAIEYALEDAK